MSNRNTSTHASHQARAVLLHADRTIAALVIEKANGLPVDRVRFNCLHSSVPRRVCVCGCVCVCVCFELESSSSDTLSRGADAQLLSRIAVLLWHSVVTVSIFLSTTQRLSDPSFHDVRYVLALLSDVLTALDAAQRELG